MKKIILPLCAVALLACSTTPKSVTVENGNERSLSCEQIAEEMRIAQQSKVDAHKDDKFKIGNMFAYWWMYNMMKADSRATERLELLGGIARAKGCGM